MTRPFLVPFKAEHMLAFVPRGTPVLPEMRFALAKEKGGPAFTAMLDDRVIGCAGIVLLWPGVGSAWVVFDKEIEKHSVWMTRHVKAVLRDTARCFKLHRVEAVVPLENPSDMKWINLLGFRTERDGLAQLYTQDRRDVVRFEMLP